MLTHYTITLTHTAPRLPQSAAYALYGELMRRLGEVAPDYAAALHQADRTPIAQYITSENGVTTWRVTLFGDARDAVGAILGSSDHYALSSPEVALEVAKTEIVRRTQRQLVDAVHHDGGLCKLNFLSPTAFKMDGEYVMFPTVPLIINNLIGKWNACSPDIVIADDDAVRAIVAGTRLTAYNLRSNYFTVKGAKIPAFVGEVLLRPKLPVPLMQIFALLMSFAPYCGVGIKCALGMGGCTVDYRGES